MKPLEKLIIDTYIPGETTLREVARIANTNHHKVKKVLLNHGIEIKKGKRSKFTEDHKRNISISCKGRSSWSKGKKMQKISIYKNMASHLRFNVSAEWISQFEDIEKLKFLNRCIQTRLNRFKENSQWYQEYISKFYSDAQFNNIYHRWVGSGNKYLRPTIDHIKPKSKGGDNSIDNLQFLTWFENRAKDNMEQWEWDHIKSKIKEYLI